ncbi:histidine kinase [Sporosarcina sp. E16_3]|uniref:sensor histidine kinase n=1 Tax=Sporosarcina sp. E16_3 TaxID=2789293 RepID=UPI001A92F044|nr:histidine kinase [Sporosarcina sp. E16_3]MBO0600721.1 histidine kinase [Sporosarcina sp. E16_3]
MSLRNKIFITFSLLLLLPLIVVGIVVQNIFMSSKSEEVITKVENTIIQLNYNLDLMLEDASRSTISILYNKELVDVLREYDMNTPITHKKYSHVKLLSLFLSSMTFNKNQIYGIHIFAKNGQLFSHMDNYRIEDQINLQEQEWYLKAKEQEGGWITYYDKNPVYYKNNSEKYVSFLRLLRDPENHNELGVIRIDFAPKYIREITEQLGSENWQISTAHNEPLMGSQSDYLLSSCPKNQSWIKTEQSNQKYFCVTHTSSKTGLKISNVIPKDYLYSEISEFNNILLLLIGFCLLISLLISYYMTNYLLKPLELLKTRIRGFQENKLANSNSIQSKNEIVELRVAYDGMLSDIDYLVAEVYEINLRNSEAEYKALQSQMDPHFLFNTLESINMTAINNDQFEISDMIAELGKLIRYRLKNEEQQIPLQEEIIFAKNYVSIMKNRLEDALDVHWDVEGEIVDHLVPKYIIQPIIENSIMHGYSNRVKRVEIFVKVKMEGSALTISVSDNGTGIDNFKLLKIKESLKPSLMNNDYGESPGKLRNGIALININRRLRLIHGTNSMLLISSQVGMGTQVDIIIRK